jgi:tRNA (mo5U34)-methyltransferase
MDAGELRREVIRLAPWHLKVQITPELSSAAFLDAELTTEQARLKVSFIDPHEPWRALVQSLYPDGLGGRTVLDCACNCGAYSFWMKELGAGAGLGFDARQRWIDQARFLLAHRSGPSDGLRFEVGELGELDRLTDDSFDISIFKGIFYHLPDPIHALGLVAGRTRELLVLNTSVRADLPDGLLVASRESVVDPMSGVHGLSWFPTGPGVIADMLESVGFPASRCTLWVKRDPVVANLGRVELLAARDESTFEAFDTARSRLGPRHAYNAWSDGRST